MPCAPPARADGGVFLAPFRLKVRQGFFGLNVIGGLINPLQVLGDILAILPAAEVPHLDFSHLDDCWWHDGEKDHRGISVEPEEILLERANRFADFLKLESIHSTAIVSHGNFIRALTGIQPKNCEVIEFNPR